MENWGLNKLELQAFCTKQFKKLIIFKKQRMEYQSKRYQGRLFHFFMIQNSLDPKLQLLSQIIESIVYGIIMNGVNFSTLLGSLSSSALVFSVLFALCILKLTLGVMLRFGITLVSLQLIVTKSDSWMIPNCILLLVLFASQFLSSIAFDYSSPFLQVESRIQNKAIHLFLLVENIIILSLVQSPQYFHLASSVLFLGLLWSKERSLMKSEEYRGIALRFYLYAAANHLRLFITQFLPFASSFSAAVLSFLLSQSLFAVLMRCRPTPSCHQLMAKEEHLHLAFLLLRYCHSSIYDRKLEQFSFSLVGESISIDISEKEAMKDLKPPFHTSKEVIAKSALSLLSKSDGFLQTLLRAQIHIEAGRTFLALKQLEQGQMKLSKYDFLRRVMLFHAKQGLAASFSIYTSKVTFEHEEASNAFLSFQQLLYRAAMQHLRFNLYLKRTEIELSKIKSICFKLLSIDSEVQKKFEEVRQGFTTSTELFVGFLARVLGEYAAAQQLISRQQLRQKYLLDCHLQDKMFVRILVSSDGLTINRVGFNACELLGYNRGELEGQRVQRLIPLFFRDQHLAISSAFVQGPSSRMLLFQRQTIVLNGQGGYNFCEIVLRLGMADGLCYEGYIRVVESKEHDLNSFFSANAEGMLLQWSEGLFEQEDTERNITRVQQLLTGILGERLVRTTNNHLYEVYDPVLVFKQENYFFFYAKRLINKNQASKEQMRIDSLKEMTAPMLEGRIQSFQEFNKESAQEILEMQGKIKNKEIYIQFIVVVLLIFALFGSEYLMVLSANVKSSNQSFAISSFVPLVQFYQNLIHLEINILYFDLNSNYNYSNNFTKPTIDQIVLRLQNVNQKLKRFNLGKYTLPTYNSVISYQESLYQFIQMIIADAEIYQKFFNDNFTKTATFDQFKLVVTTMLTKNALADLRTSMLSLTTSLVQADNYYENLSLGVILSNTLIFFLIAFRIFWKLRHVEDEALQLRCVNLPHESKIKDILSFVRDITLEEVPIDKLSEEMRVYELVSKVQNNISILMSEASLIKDHTARNISMDGGIPLETVNKPGFLQNMEKKESNENVPNNSSYLFIKTNSHIYVIIIFFAFAIILVTLAISNQVLNYIVKNVDESASLNNLFTIQKSTTFYSHRGVIMTLIAILQKNEKGLDISTAYLSFYQPFLTFVTTVSIPSLFPEMSFSEFSNASTNLNRLYQDPLCTYVTCDPQYYDQINLNYMSVMKKYGSNLSSIFRSTLNYTKPQMTAYISSNKRYFDILLYTEKVIREYVTDLIMNYLNSYDVFRINLYSSKLNYTIAMIVITAAGLLLFLLFVRHSFKEQEIFIRMLKIYQKQLKK